MLDTSTTSKLIKDARMKAGLTQDQLADKLHVTKQAVSNWERGCNLPDEAIRETIEQELGIKLHKENMCTTIHQTSSGKIPELKELSIIDNVDDIVTSVEKIIDSVVIDNYHTPVKKMLHLTLIAVLGYEIYYEGHCSKFFSDYPLDWGTTASDLHSLIEDLDDWFLGDTRYPFRTASKLSRKIEFMSFLIGGELFEDFDEDGYRNDFVQQIGRYGQEFGHDLLALLPETNTDIMVVYKTAIMDIIDTLYETTAD